MCENNYLKMLVEEIHSATVATIGADGHPQTRTIDMMLWDENGVYFLTATGTSSGETVSRAFSTQTKEPDKIAQLKNDELIWKHENMHILFLELGVGANKPVIIKYPFWRMTAKNPKAVYACINQNEAFCPHEIRKQSICINDDTGKVLERQCAGH